MTRSGGYTGVHRVGSMPRMSVLDAAPASVLPEFGGLEAPHDHLEIRDAASRGFALSTAQVTFSRVLSLISFLVLARLLTPADYGTATLANVFVALLSLLAASGFGGALVQRISLDKAYLDTSFWLTTVTGLVLTGGLAGAALPIAALFGQPLLGPVLAAMSVNFFVIGLTVVPAALLQREFQFGALAKASVISNVLATTVGIVFAIVGFGVWALVVQTILAPLISLIYVWTISSYRPSLSISTHQIGPIYRTSSAFLGTSFVEFMSQYADDFLIGARLGAGLLGVYTVGYRLVFVMIDILGNSLTIAALPVFSRLQNHRIQLRGAYTTAIALSALLCMPCFAVALAAAPQIVLVVFGHTWIAAIPLLRIFALFGALEAVMTINQVFLQGAGAAGVALKLSIAGALLQVGGFVVAVQFGIAWVAAAYVLRAYLIAPFGLSRAAKLIGISTWSSLARVGLPALSAAIAGGVVYLVGRELPGLPEAVGLTVMVVSGLAVYAALAALAMRGHMADLRTLIVSLRTRSAAQMEVTGVQ